MTAQRVAIIRGGPSEEHAVSMHTGASVLQALRDTSFRTKDIVVSKNGEWLLDGFVREPERALADVDVVFIALHGAYGEDGTIQKILERFSIPYTGSGSYASALAINKALTKEYLKTSGVLTPKHMRLTRAGVADAARTAKSIEHLFGPQFIVKPQKGGSSVHTFIARGEHELAAIIERALSLEPEILVEERISGKEATVGVLEHFRDEALYQLPEIEIIPPKGSEFFDENVKYDGTTQEICPGNFSKQQKKDLLTTAAAVHNALNLRHYSRSDFIVSGDDVYFLEINTLPGLTAESLFPKAMHAVGSDFKELVTHLLTLAEITKR